MTRRQSVPATCAPNTAVGFSMLGRLNVISATTRSTSTLVKWYVAIVRLRLRRFAHFLSCVVNAQMLRQKCTRDDCRCMFAIPMNIGAVAARDACICSHPMGNHLKSTATASQSAPSPVPSPPSSSSSSSSMPYAGMMGLAQPPSFDFFSSHTVEEDASRIALLRDARHAHIGAGAMTGGLTMTLGRPGASLAM